MFVFPIFRRTATNILAAFIATEASPVGCSLSNGYHDTVPGDFEDTQQSRTSQHADAQWRHDTGRGEDVFNDTTHHHETVKTVE